LLTALANLRIVQQQPDEACRLYRRVVELQPRDIESLNNLATILGEQPSQAAEALNT